MHKQIHVHLCIRTLYTYTYATTLTHFLDRSTSSLSSFHSGEDEETETSHGSSQGPVPLCLPGSGGAVQENTRD